MRDHKTDLLGVGHVEAQEVDQLAGCIDLGLIHILGLPKHGRGIDLIPVRA